MATLKFVITTVFASYASDPFQGVDDLPNPMEVVNQINIHGDQFRFQVLHYISWMSKSAVLFLDDTVGGTSDMASVVVGDNNEYDVDGGRLLVKQNLPDMPYKTSFFEITIPRTLPFDIGDYTYITFDESSRLQSYYTPTDVTSFAMWVYHDDVLIADTGSAVVTDVNNFGGNTVRRKRVELLTSPAAFWTELRGAREEI